MTRKSWAMVEFIVFIAVFPIVWAGCVAGSIAARRYVARIAALAA